MYAMRSYYAWQSTLRRQGFEVVAEVKGLGSQVAPIFVRHAADAAAEAGVELR